MLFQTRRPKSTPHQNANFSPSPHSWMGGRKTDGWKGGVGICPLVTPVDRMWHGAKYFMAVHSGARNWKWIPSERSHLHENQSLQILSCNLHIVQTSTLSKQKMKNLYRNIKVRVILHVSWRLLVKKKKNVFILAVAARFIWTCSFVKNIYL